MPKEIYDKFEPNILKDIKKYSKRIQRLYYDAIDEVAKAAATIGNFDPNKPFKWADYPIIKKRIDKIIGELRKQLRTEINEGTNRQWNLANKATDAMILSKISKDLDRLTKEQRAYYFKSTSTAQEAFRFRVKNGMNLSKRVWNLTEQFKTELEMGLDLGLSKGKSAASMATELKQYLNEPDKLFRRVRDKNGVLRLSKAARDYHPGRGVNRSSYKNALRLTVNENNMAYRTANQSRWSDLAMVVGIEVILGNNENHCPVCIALKGFYPKDFIFKSWHPNCFCNALPVLKSKKEMDEDFDRILAGKEPLKRSVNTVKKVNPAFNDYIRDNIERIKKAQSKGTLGYFLEDNKKYWAD